MAPSSTPRPARRAVVVAGALTAAGVALPTASGGSDLRDQLGDAIGQTRAAWELLPPITVVDACQHWAHLAEGRPGDDWAALRGQVALLHARALADIGETHPALDRAEAARKYARQIGDPQTHAWATLVAAEVHDAAQPGSVVPMRMAAIAAERAGKSWVGVHAAVVRACLIGRAGEPGMARVVDAATDADQLVGTLADPTPGEFTAPQAFAFIAVALTRVGMFVPARRRLADVADAFSPRSQPGMASAIAIWQAGTELAAGDVLTAGAHAARAVDIAQDRPTAWLADSILAQNTRAGGQGGYGKVTARVAGWPSTLTGPV
ncbi:hypothetical protein [Pseudofrankia inefficax]|uniref:Uncharacterized protein n=1 Tax=Pseudofrankia inefficax (strain DSM 45817 / CECT 9037 / DDB 130130 / EuI1c) TaxID=298654 RepID=E3J659_PSEI1|nr:hypothetical protein [Pseudofrankia inefficax]ADP78350.1 hypothetical protein FraEuI1c_0264 [Pseudofrankia inefficax]